MCGVTLCFSTSSRAEAVAERLAAMESAQAHRGPDGTGALVMEVGAGVLGVAQQRLSIPDLTPAGSQSMVSSYGRYVLSYNGEVYNYQELAAELDKDPILPMPSGDTAVGLVA